MNKFIAIMLMNKLIPQIKFADKFGGIVQVVQKKTAVGQATTVIKKIPYSNVYKIPSKEQIQNAGMSEGMQFIPEEKFKGLIYFEDEGCSLSNIRHTRLTMYNAKLRLVCWINMKKISREYNVDTASMAINQASQILCNSKYEQQPFFGVRVSVTTVPPQSANIFSRYDFDQTQGQYLMPPFEFFAMDLNIRFGVPKNCYVGLDPETNLPICCK
jgi:hypothetical protein